VVYGGEAFGDLKFGVWKEDREKAFYDHIVKFCRWFINFDDTTGRDDREVVGYLSVVKDTLLEFEAVILKSVLGPIG